MYFSILLMLHSSNKYVIMSSNPEDEDVVIEEELNPDDIWIKYRNFLQKEFTYINDEKIDQYFFYNENSCKPINIQEERNLGLAKLLH